MYKFCSYIFIDIEEQVLSSETDCKRNTRKPFANVEFLCRHNRLFFYVKIVNSTKLIIIPISFKEMLHGHDIHK